MANEPGLEIEFTPGLENTGANLLSRPLFWVRDKRTSLDQNRQYFKFWNRMKFGKSTCGTLGGL